jgi:putrescine importer
VVASKGSPGESESSERLRRSLGLFDLVLYGIVIVQPTAPMPIFGVVYKEARGHVATCVLVGMVAIFFTALSYGRMARVYPSAGSAFTYVGRELHGALGYLTGWSMVLDYLLNPTICAIWCARAAQNFVPGVPHFALAALFVALSTGLNCLGIRTSARVTAAMAAAMGAVILVFFAAAVHDLAGAGGGAAAMGAAALARPLYDPATFSAPAVLTGSSIAVLTYMGFDGISTLSEEARNPRRDILRATVLTCVVTGVLSFAEVYVAQLVWPAGASFPDPDTAFVAVAGRVGGPALFALVNATLLVATFGSELTAQLGAARLLYGMGRAGALPRSFFGAVEPRRAVPRNNVLLVGGVSLVGALLLSYQLGAELLNFGAFVAFMGVNVAALVRTYVRAPAGGRRLRDLAAPALGASVCFVIWLGLRWPALVLGGAWLLLGLVVGAVGGRGFAPLPNEDGGDA